MSVTLFCCLFLILIYSIWIMILALAWSKLPKTTETTINGKASLSVIVPFRNEADNIRQLATSLVSQLHENIGAEIIFVDDHSEDHSADILSEMIRDRNNIRLIDPGSGTGKKNALKAAISAAQHEWIITLDADVSVGVDWLDTLRYYCTTTNSDMLILPVMIDGGHSVFGKMQSLEFMSITGITAASAARGNALLCNGANLAFKKSSYLNSLLIRKDHKTPSGDDMFLLAYVKKKGKVRWVHDLRILATLQPENTLQGFLNQRIRWASKTGQINDPSLIMSSLLVFIINAIAVFLIFVAISHPTSRPLALAGLAIKVISDFFLLRKVSGWMCKTRLMRLFIVLSLIYPFYAILIPLLGLFYTPAWKGRKIKR